MSVANLMTLVTRPLSKNGIVGRLEPDLLAIFTEAPELGALELAPRQGSPKVAVGLPLPLGGIDKQAVMLPQYLGKPVAHRREEVGVSADDGAVWFELNHGLRPVDCSKLCRFIFFRSGSASYPMEHCYFIPF